MTDLPEIPRTPDQQYLAGVCARLDRQAELLTQLLQQGGGPREIPVAPSFSEPAPEPATTESTELLTEPATKPARKPAARAQRKPRQSSKEA
ncbi:hypothetical protein EDD29_0065 [Actinocorallia herbida]|uniref:Uncharacterized protein n=1 Tax=Actinocorallia herbida TaxID=58109 RepID=A0A3N1CN00_9ACTN|nr:hypothetical protein [Actinocorallia herbida]ROO82585.1 hypothetical protein EDD29_0065 [Actinocorallia herbida]